MIEASTRETGHRTISLYLETVSSNAVPNGKPFGGLTPNPAIQVKGVWRSFSLWAAACWEHRKQLLSPSPSPGRS